MKNLMMFFTIFSFATSFTQDLPTIQFSVGHNQEYNQTTWQQVHYLTGGLIKYLQKNHEQKQKPLDDKALKEIAKTIEYIYALTRKDQSFQINFSTSCEDITSEQNDGVSIQLIFEPDDGTNTQKIQELLDELSATYHQNPEIAFKNIQKTVKAIWSELGENADIRLQVNDGQNH